MLKNTKFKARLPYLLWPLKGLLNQSLGAMNTEWKYPERKWNNKFYHECAFQWKGKEKELEERVIKLEKDMIME